MNVTRKQRRNLINEYFDVKRAYDDGYRTKKRVSIVSRQDGSLAREGESITWLATHSYFPFDYMIDNHLKSFYTYADKIMYGQAEDGSWHVWTQNGVYTKVFRKGDVVKRGDEAYEATDKMDFIKRALQFWWGEEENRIYTKVSIENEDEKGFDIRCQWSEDPLVVANPEARGQYTEHHYNFPKEYGRGEWTAETEDDAREMALAYIRNLTLMTL